MISRRDVMLGGLFAASMGAAHALVPRRVMASNRDVDLETAIPPVIGRWHELDMAGNILPQDEGTLSAQLYSQLVSRVYAPSGPERDAVMMVIAYGDSQSDTLQLHRPEVCYEAAGFRVIRSEPVHFKTDVSGEISARYLVAEAAYRREAILYWTRIGDALPTDRLQQQLAKLDAGLSGVVPDGTLSRLSVLIDADQPMPPVLTDFANEMMKSISLPARQALVGAKVARS